MIFLVAPPIISLGHFRNKFDSIEQSQPCFHLNLNLLGHLIDNLTKVQPLHLILSFLN